MLCSDEFVNYLKPMGYCVLRLPRADVRPLQLYVERGGELTRLGELTTVLVARDGSPPPPVRENVASASVAGKRSGWLSAGLGVSILKGVLSAMGGLPFGLDTHYERARSLAFEFPEVMEDSIEVARLDQYLAGADIHPLSQHAAELLEADDVYVVTSTLKGRKIGVVGKAADGASAEVHIPAIQQVVGAGVQISGQAERTSAVLYEGPAPLVFGFQAVRLSYREGRYHAFEPTRAGGVVMRGANAAPDPDPQFLSVPSPFVRVRSA